MEECLMRIGLLSDTHDRVPAIRALLEQMIAGGIDRDARGDYCSPFSLQPFDFRFRRPGCSRRSPHSFDLGIAAESEIRRARGDRARLHMSGDEARGDSLVVNPGEACGWLHGAPSGAILDLETKSVEFLKLTGPEWKF
jgi:hypothetical protein